MGTARTRCARSCERVTAGKTAGGAGAPRAEAGLSLVEIMVAMAVGLIVVLIATTIYLQGASSFNFRVGQSENLGNSRYALGTMAEAFAKAGYRRDPMQEMDAAFPADSARHSNGCQFTQAGQAIYAAGTDALCIRYQARDAQDSDCAGQAAGISGLKAYEAPAAAAVGAGLIVEKYGIDDGRLTCHAAAKAGAKTEPEPVPVADGVKALHIEFGVGATTDSLAERHVESFKTSLPTEAEAVRALRYAVLLASASGGLTGGMASSVCTRWEDMGGDKDRCDTSKGHLYQVASGTVTLRNLMP